MADDNLILDLMNDEAEAVEKYQSYAAKVSDPELRQLFLHIAAEEQNHKQELSLMFCRCGRE